MKGKKIISALQYVDPELIEEAMEQPNPVAKKSRYRFGTLIAACLCLICSAGALWYVYGDKLTPPEFTQTPTFASISETEPIETGAAVPTEDGVEMGGPMVSDGFRVALLGEDNLSADIEEFFCNWEAWCADNEMDMNYYNRTDFSIDGAVAVMEQAIMEGNNVLILQEQGYEDIAMEVARWYPDIYFIVMVNAEGTQLGGEDVSKPSNFYPVSQWEDIPNFIIG